MSLAQLPPVRDGVSATVMRSLLRVATVLFVGFLAVVVAVHVYYPPLLYPAPTRDLHAPAEGRLLTAVARDGVRVHATEFSGPEGAPVILYFHGNGEVMGDVFWMAREFVRRGIGVVLAEYRGYGLSARSTTAAPSEAGLYEDAEAVLAALAARGISSDQIVLFGASLGTGVAVEMAARGHGSAVVLVTPYTSIPDVASRFALGLPVGALMRERFDSIAKAQGVAVPALIIHGTDDEVVPYAMGVKLAATLPHSRVVTVAGGHHNDLFLGERWRLFDEVAEFVQRRR